MRSLRKSKIKRLGAGLMLLLCLLWDAHPLMAYRPQSPPAQRRELRSGLTQTPGPELRRKIEARAQEAREAAIQQKPDVRVLSPQEMRRLAGRGPYRNAYFNGVLPWQRSLRDVNLCNGNLFKSFTDIQVSPARGAGLALQRTYNSNDARVGPFGVGWTHAYEIRMEEAGGNNVPRTDFFGGKHIYHRDADGLYSPPAYLFDELSSEYNKFLLNGPVKPLTDTQKGMDGSVKHFFANGNERDCDYIQDRNGNRTTLAYAQPAGMPDGSTRNLLTLVTDPSGRSLTFTWANLGTAQRPAWRITQVQGPQYNVTYGYYTDPASPNAANELFNLHTVTLDPAGLNRTTTYTYTGVAGSNGNENGLLSSVSDPLGHTISYSYTTTCVLGGNVVNTFTNTAWVSQVTEPAGVDQANAARTQTWTIAIQATNAVMPGSPSEGNILVSASSSSGLAMACMSDHQLREWNLWPGNAVLYLQSKVYDAANNVVEVMNPAYPTIQLPSDYFRTDLYTYGPHGNVLTHSVAGFPGQETTSYYNASKYFQKQSVTDALGRTSTFDYYDSQDPNPGNRGNARWVRDARYGTTGKQFDYTYNQYGQKASETNLNGVVTQYAYGDQWGNLTQVAQDFGGLARTTALVYDVAGHVLSSTDPMQRTSSVTYSTLGQPLATAFPATANTPAETVAYTYGGNGRTESVSDNRGATVMSYEAGCDRMHSVTDPVTGSFVYTYGVRGERLSLGLPGGGTWTYGYRYDTSSETMPKDDPESMSWQLVRVTDDMGRRVDYNVDLNPSEPDIPAVGMLRNVRSNESFDVGGSLVQYSQVDYTYDRSTQGNVVQSRYLQTQVKNTWHWYAPDTPGGYPTWHQRILSQNDYTYDNSGSRLTNTITNQNGVSRTEQYTYDELNRLGTVNYGDGGTQSYSFDPMGNRLQKTDSATGTENYSYNNANMLLSRNTDSYVNDANGNTLTGGGRVNTWDSQNRLVQCITGTSTCQYGYGADGLRRQSTISSGQTTTTTNFVLDGQSVVRERQNGANTATYLTGPGGPMYRRNDVDGSIRWYVFDGLGTVVGEVDPSGNVTATRACDVYGATRGAAGTATSKHGFVGSLGHTTEPETGLVYMRARYYDPGVARFVSEDPAKNGPNWFIYADNSPTMAVDADGKNAELLAAAIAQFTAAMMMSPTYRNIIAPVFITNIAFFYNPGNAEIDAGVGGTFIAGKAAYNSLITSLTGAYDKAGKEGAESVSIGQNIIGIGLGYAAQMEIYMFVLDL